MHYTVWELGFYFFVYSLMGWVLEVAWGAMRTGKFVNRGLFNGPICPAYGTAMCLILVFLRDMGGNFPIQLIACMVLANVVEFFTGWLEEKITGRSFEKFRQEVIVLHSWHGLVYTCLWGALAMLTLYLVHPFVFLLSQLIPLFALKILVGCLAGLLVVDAVATAALITKTRRDDFLAQGRVPEGLQAAKQTLGQKLYNLLRERMCRAFPEFREAKPTGKGFGKPREKRFAKGLCLPKLIWIFVICALLGDWIETVYVFGVSGVLMSRSSLLYGTFSVVWGFGAVLLTVLLEPLSRRDDRYVFIGGFFLGGFYEYMCSVFTELVFGTVFWDYSHMPLNIGGRTNVLFMLFWGVLSVVWIKLLYPRLSAFIEKWPPVLGTVLTWAAVVLLCADMIISAAAMVRYLNRQDGRLPQNSIEEFMDSQYPDSLIEWTWPNMKTV